MNMNYGSIPYEANYSDDIMGMNQLGMSNANGGSIPMSMPMGMPMAVPGGNMNQIQQMPMGNMASMPAMPSMPMSMPAAAQMGGYPMQRNMIQSQPMSMAALPQMQQVAGGSGANSMAMSMSQLPPGAVAPLNSVSVMPMMGGGGGIDGGGMNVVVPDLQPMSSMSSMGQNSPGRMSGGSSAGNTNWMHGGMMPNNVWNYPTQGYPNMQQQQQQQQQHLQLQQHQQQQHQQHQQHHQRMKSQSDYGSNSNSYRETRNGLNSPSMHGNFRGRSSSIGMSVKKAQHWR